MVNGDLKRVIGCVETTFDDQIDKWADSPAERELLEGVKEALMHKLKRMFGVEDETTRTTN